MCWLFVEPLLLGASFSMYVLKHVRHKLLSDRAAGKAL